MTQVIEHLPSKFKTHYHKKKHEREREKDKNNTPFLTSTNVYLLIFASGDFEVEHFGELGTAVWTRWIC
jgi:hypothetical protein